jgi:TusA-related sulfurtransferase
MWPFRKQAQTNGIAASSVNIVDGIAEIDVRGQTCPGYLLAINKAVDQLDSGMKAKLLITYAPCGEDIKAWCRKKQIEFLDLTQSKEMWIIHIQK